MDTSLQESDAVTSSVSSGFLHSVSTISDNSKLQLAPSIRTHKLWCQARALLAPVSLATKMSASKLIHYFSSHPAAFGFQASTPPDNISLNLANRKVDQSLSDFQTGLGATAHATLDTEQLISCLQVALVDTLSSLPEAEGDVILVSEVHELLLQIHGILDKQFGNSAHILAPLPKWHGKKSAGGTVSTSSTESRRKGTPDVSQPSVSSSSTSAPFQVGMLFKFLDQWRSITSSRFVLNMVQGHHLQLRSHPPLLSIIAGFYVLFGIRYLISGGFYLLDLPQLLGFSHPSLNLFCSFAIAKVCILSSIWMKSWSLFALSGQVKGHTCFCVPCWSILVYI